MTNYNTGNPIGSTDPRDLYDNADNLDELVNSQTKDSHPDRLGRERLTWKGITAAGTGDTSVAVDAAARAVDAAGRAENAEAVVDAANIEAAVTRAETARDAAFVNADVYPDIATGRAAVADGEQFQVVEGDEIVRYRRDSASTQTEVARYPAASAIANLFSIDVTGPIVEGEGINSTNGAVVVNENFKRTNYIEVNGGVTFYYKGKVLQNVALAFYDAEMGYVAGVSSTKPGLYTAPEGSVYVRASTDTREETELSVRLMADSTALLHLEEKTGLLELLDYTVLSDGYVKPDGTVTVTPNYSVTGFIPISDASVVYYSGSYYTGVSVAAVIYDKDFNPLEYLVVSRPPIGESSVRLEGAAFIIDNPLAAYIRASASKNVPIVFSLRTSKLNTSVGTPPRPELQYLLEEDQVATVDLVVEADLTNEYLLENGTTVGPSNYRLTPFLPITNNSIVEYTGYAQTPAIPVALFDKNYSFLEAPVLHQSSSPWNYSSARFEVSNPDVAYMRACSSLSAIEPFSLRTKKYNSTSGGTGGPSLPNIILVPQDANNFRVGQLTGSGEYLYHTFFFWDDDLRAQRGWSSRQVEHNGVNIAQGNFNFIHWLALDGEEAYVGLGHGCEIQRWCQFFVDGKEFVPGVDSLGMTGDRFHFRFLSDIFAADETKETGDRTQPQLPLINSSIHYMDCEITRDGVNRYNKLILQRDGTIFKEACAAMQQTNQPLISGPITINGKLPFRVHFPNSPDVAEPLAPDSTGLGDQIVAFADKVTATGESADFAYSVETWMSNCDPSKNASQSIRSWVSRETSNKFYFNPVVTTSSASQIGRPAEVFNEGDIIETISYTKYGVTPIG